MLRSINTIFNHKISIIWMELIVRSELSRQHGLLSKNPKYSIRGRSRTARMGFYNRMSLPGWIVTSTVHYFQGKNSNESVALLSPSSIQLDFSCNMEGYTSNEQAKRCLRENFEYQTREKANRRSCNLIFDEHGSHTTSDILCHCILNDIQIGLLPPHKSHLRTTWCQCFQFPQNLFVYLDESVYSNRDSSYQKRRQNGRMFTPKRDPKLLPTCANYQILEGYVYSNPRKNR